MIDIHSHIIFDIDDGAETFEESLDLCRQAYENGFDGIVATPHFKDYRNIGRFVIERDTKLQEIRDVLKREGIDLALYSGSELYLSEGIFNAGNLDDLTINGSRYMLCEFPLGPFNVEEGLSELVELTERGYIPIVAHPERYYEIHKNTEIINRMLRRGAIFQVNADSISGRFGEFPQKIAVDLVTEGFAKFISSDAHDIEHRNMDFRKKFAHVPSEITREILVDCLIKYPKAIINDNEI